MAAGQRKKNTERALEVLKQQPPVDVPRDSDHLADSARKGERKRVERELQHRERMEEIASNERLEKARINTVRLRYLLFLILAIVAAIFKLKGVELTEILDWSIFKNFFGGK
ncbi:MAG: hypothetical protein KDJ29_18230 [Hyphomicrobiales bacterium]|nr:hypothetical protein [Nitratireductor sp.]MCC2098835.1 hypothetical protein [Hyphomicrobiales bacterium]